MGRRGPPAAPVAGVEETGSVIECDAATEMPAASDDATVVPAAPKAVKDEDTTGIPAAAMSEVERADRVERGAVLDFDFSVPAEGQADDGDNVKLSGPSNPDPNS